MNDIGLYERYLSASEAIRSEFKFNTDRAFFLGNKQLSAIKYPTDKFLQYSALPGFEDLNIIAGGIYIGDLTPDRLVVTEPLFENDINYDVRLQVLGIRLLQLLGIEELFIFGKGDQLNSEAEEAQLFWAEDHLNLSGINPLVGPNIDELGERFPDMTRIYDSELTLAGIQAAEKLELNIKKGAWASTWDEDFLGEKFVDVLLENKVNVIGHQGIQEAVVAAHGNIKIALTLLISDGEKEDEILINMLKSISSESN